MVGVGVFTKDFFMQSLAYRYEYEYSRPPMYPVCMPTGKEVLAEVLELEAEINGITEG